MNVVNLTPHEVVIMDENEEVVKRVQKSGFIARLKTRRVHVGTTDKIPFYETEFSDVVLLDENKNESCFPPAQENTIYIVSGMFLANIEGMGGLYDPRTDLWSPGELVRDENGNVIGCIGLSQY